MIRNIDIENFKSIKNLSLNCKKVNLFIGKPNVGKSNILEALTLFGNLKSKEVRSESVRNFFYDQDIEKLVKVQIDNFYHLLRFDTRNNGFNSYLFDSVKLPLQIKTKIQSNEKQWKADSIFFNDLALSKNSSISSLDFRDLSAQINFDQTKKMAAPRIKRYSFRSIDTRSRFAKANLRGDTLDNPYGENLFTILKNNKKLREEVSSLFEEYGYSLIIDFVSNEAEIQKLIDNIGYKVPYSLIADTLQRMVFYIVAIRSNKDCTILLEEPENHSFPPYIRDIAFEISESNNQFFIATHSPYLFNTLLSECKKDELFVNIVSYENFETKVKTLDEVETSEIMSFGIDAFFNIDSFSR